MKKHPVVAELVLSHKRCEIIQQTNRNRTTRIMSCGVVKKKKKKVGNFHEKWINQKWGRKIMLTRGFFKREFMQKITQKKVLWVGKLIFFLLKLKKKVIGIYGGIEEMKGFFLTTLFGENWNYLEGVFKWKFWLNFILNYKFGENLIKNIKNITKIQIL